MLPLRSIPVSMLLFGALVAAPGQADAKTFYVDPNTGSAAGDGSAARPWRTIEAVIAANLVSTRVWSSLPYKAGATLVAKNASAPIKPGDTILLRSGYHGVLSISSHYNASMITIAAAPGHTPQLKNVLVRSSRNWTIRGLSVSPSFAPKYDKTTLISVESHSFRGPVSDVVVERCTGHSVADVSAWSKADWNSKAPNGISVGGTRITIRGNSVKNVNLGISVGATRSRIERNTVENFAGDGLRGLGDYTTFEYNTVKNAYAVNANHDDGFQSWSRGKDGKVGTGEVVGVVLRGNLIINYTDPKQKFRATLQGIGMFDGTFVDWVIENNVVIVDHWHGISLLGARNCRVINNTVIDPNTTRPGPAWIRIGNHKSGTKPSGCVVRNNLAPALNNEKSGVTVDHNIIVKTPRSFYVDPAKYDLYPLATSPAVDKGSATLAAKIDVQGVARPQGAAVDVGAHEWQPQRPSARPDGGASSADAGTADAGSTASVDAAPATGDAAAIDDQAGCECGVSADPRGAVVWLVLFAIGGVARRRL